MRRLTSAVGLLLALVLAGCGGGGESAAPPAPSDPGAAPTAPTTTSEGPAGEAPSPGDGALDAPEGFTAVTLLVTRPDGTTVEVCVWLADDRTERARGLMAVDDPELGGKAGMAFLFEEDSTSGFWMRNTLLPLSIAYVDADGGVVSTADMEPCPPATERCPTYEPAGPYRLALEVPQGRLPDVGVEPGSRLELGGDCPATAT